MALEYLALSYGGQKKFPEAITEYRNFLSVDQPYPFILALLAHAYASNGQRSEAEKLLGELLKSKIYVSATTLALVYVALGDRTRALDNLDRAWTKHDNLLQYLKNTWLFDPIRSEPRFARLMERMGFPQ